MPLERTLNTNWFISAFLAVFVIGTCNIKGIYNHYFEFHLADLLNLFHSITNWTKVYTEEANAPEQGVIISRETQMYCWKKKFL